MPSITNSAGPRNYITIDRESLKPHERVEVLARPGVNGVALRATGFRGHMQRRIALVDVKADDGAALKVLIAAQYALQNTMVTVISNNGVETQKIWITEVDVEATRITGALGGLEDDGQATHLLTTRFLWVDTNTE